jgi:threonine dehydrogenase-like Zn-dependent dehydrogenase
MTRRVIKATAVRLRVHDVPEPRILNDSDAIVRVRASSVCGSDLHLLNGYLPAMREGDILGHEFLGEVVEVGPGVRRLSVGDRVVVGSIIGCGGCWYCERGEWSLCDRFTDRLGAAADRLGVDTVNSAETDVLDALREMTAGRGPDACVEAVGLEAHEVGAVGAYDKAKQFVRAQSDRPTAVREAIMACRKGGTVSIVGVFVGLVDKFPLGAAMNKALTLRMGQMHAQRYIPMLLERLAAGEIDTSYLATHPMPLSDGPRGYELFERKRDGCLRAVLHP